MLEAGKKFRHLVQFNSGQPTSAFVYTLYNQDGDVVLTDSVTIPVGQLSYLIQIPAVNNVLSKPLFEKMVIEWEYTTATEAVDGSISFIIHLPIGFPVDPSNVRNLLGVDEEELPDDDIKLFEGFMAFKQRLAADADLTPYIESGDLNSFTVAKAIEAATALLLFPTLQIRLPRKYDSGTSAYERWNNIDWESLAAELEALIGAGLVVITPEYDFYSDTAIFVLSDRGPDAITGA